MFRSILATLGAVMVVGCSSVSHSPLEYLVVGKALPIEVLLADADVSAAGVVHFRTPADAMFRPIDLEPRGRLLWALLPTAELGPDEWVEYYIDVDVEGDLTALGSPTSPFTTIFLDAAGLILTELETHVIASDTEHPVQIVVISEQGGISMPTAEYEVPGVPGLVSAPMERDGYGRYVLTIPERAVQPGA